LLRLRKAFEPKRDEGMSLTVHGISRRAAWKVASDAAPTLDGIVENVHVRRSLDGSGAGRRKAQLQAPSLTPSRRATAPFGRRASLPADESTTTPADSEGSSQRLRADYAAALEV
jgi:hypothetical protein